MIDEKKIEEAAESIMLKQFYPFLEGIKDYRNQSKKDFMSGINWFKENLWHDASEEPQDKSEILVEGTNLIGKHNVVDAVFADDWENTIKDYGITRWLYIEDLMKGGE